MADDENSLYVLVHMCACSSYLDAHTQMCTHVGTYALGGVSVLSAAPRHVPAGPHSMIPPQSQPPLNQETVNPFAGSYPPSSTMMDGNSSSELWCWCTLLSSPTCMYIIQPTCPPKVSYCMCIHTFMYIRLCTYYVE